MAEHRLFEIEELTNRPGTYFNPETEVLLVIDDSPELDHEIFSGDEFDGEKWVLISEETPLDERHRDELLERFERAFHASAKRPSASEEDDEESEEDEDELEPDEETPGYE